MSIAVFIVDDHYMVIEGLHSLLQDERGIRWLGHASTAAACLEVLPSLQPDVILMDIGLPDDTGVSLCETVKRRYPSIFVIGLSTFSQLSYVDKMMAAGASGYLLKNASARELVDALQKVVSGRKVFSDELAKAMYRTSVRQEPVVTRREKEVLRLIADGLTNNEIADVLFVSASTIDTHRKSLLAKLNARNTAALVKIAVDRGMI